MMLFQKFPYNEDDSLETEEEVESEEGKNECSLGVKSDDQGNS